MEVERERKEKLAAARKKLNEYKLNRSGSGGKSPSPAVTTSAPSNPADVPQFYQNLNSPATTFNIFNPAAAIDNNNGVGVTSASSYFSQPSLSPTTVFSSTPAPPSVRAMADFPKETSQLFLANPYQGQGHSPNPIVPVQQQQLESSHQLPAVLDPFTPPPPPFFAPSGGPVGQQLVEERQTSYGLPPQRQQQQPMDFIPPSRTSGLFPSPEAQFDIGHIAPVPVVPQESPSQSRGNRTPTPPSDNVNVPLSKGERPYEPGGRNLLDLQEVNLGGGDYFPSAPLPDSRTSPAPPTTNEVVAGKDLAEVEHDNDMASDNRNGIGKTDETEVGHSENADLNSSNIQLFASSLFGSTGTSELDKIFSVGEHTATQAPVTVGEHPRPESSRFNHEESSPPPKNSLFSPTNEIVEDLIQPLQTVNDITAGLPAEPIFMCGTNFTSEYDPLALALAAEDNSINEVSVLDNWSDTSIPLLQSVPPETSPSPVSISNNQVSPDVLPEVMPSSTKSEETTLHQQAPDEMNVSFEPVKSQDLVTDDNVSHMKSVQEAMELQIEELRRENEYLLGRQTDLTSKIEESERLAHDFKVDRDRIKEESMTTSQALRARINSLCEENQRIVKNSTEVGVDLRVMMEEKTKQLEEMQKAVIVVSQSKMDFAARLDNELERVKELQNTVRAKDEEIHTLRTVNTELQEKLKQEQQKDAVIHQLQDQARHYQAQSETLQKELFIIRKKLKEQEIEKTQQGVELSPTSEHSHSHHHHPDQHEGPHNHDQCSSPEKSEEVLIHSSSSHLHGHDHGATENDHHQHSDHDHDNQHDHSDHDHHHHDHNDHHHDHNDHHHDHGDHDHLDENVEVVARRGPTDEFTELKKTLHRLQWENSTYRTELDILAVDAKQKHTYEEKCSTLEDENTRLRKEIEQLEHVIIQLQGENDTIGDYISLYQTQKMALKESAKEKDAQLELLAREREMLLYRLAELTSLVKDLRESKSEAGSTCADDHIHESSFPTAPSSNNKRQIEGKIRDLLTEIGSSTLIENFHPCALCSGRLMTV